MTTISSASDPDAGKTPEQLCAERSARMQQAAQMKQPDRIPVIVRLGYMLAELAGITRQELYENPDRTRAALVAAAQRFRPDCISGPGFAPGPSRALGDRSTKWPGYGMGPNGSFQFVEQEFMKSEDYDAFLEHASDWSIRVFLPRVFSELEGLATLPPLAMAAFGFYGVTLNSPAFATLAMERALHAMVESGRLQLEWLQHLRATGEALAAVGFPPGGMGGVLVEAPFDFMSDTLRGMKGIFLDMRRCPEKLLAAEDKVGRIQLNYAIAAASSMTGAKAAFFPLHRGSDGFMSIQQFERFYWPQLKQMFLRLIDEGITPNVYYEGIWDNRLHYLAELPKGKTIGYFQSTDIFKAKEILGDTMCIAGGMPVSLLTGGSVQQVREHTRLVCEVAGKGGGFIMTTSAGELEGCKPELVQAWVDATREFGTY